MKGENVDRTHLLPCVPITSSGINVKMIIERLLHVKNKLGFKDGPAILDEYGKMYRMKDLDDMLHEVLGGIFEDEKHLFPEDIKSMDDIRKFYQCFRSFWRASDTRALEQKVPSTDIDIVNRWRKVEAGGGRRPDFSMQQHYAQFDLLLNFFYAILRQCSAISG